MKFIHEGTDAAATAVAKQLVNALKKRKPTILLVCGGSNIPVEVEIMSQVKEAAPDALESLLILPMDERYGPSGHPDSNYLQLKNAGFDPGPAMWIDVLGQDLPLQETVDYYSGLVQAAFSAANTIVGVFGLGTDGHTAGVLPGSPALEDTVTTVVGYDSPPFIRLTITPSELIKTSFAYVLAYGDSKFKPLTRLVKNKESIEKLPARLLYDVSKTFVYNDQIED
jgi:6-phosphogluconolactonase/glucosamine-6-phosphate isomerase/deaminase